MRQIVNRLPGLTLSLTVSFVVYQAAWEFFYAKPLSGPWADKITSRWFGTLAELLLFSLVLLIGLSIAALWILSIWSPNKAAPLLIRLIKWRNQLKWLGGIFAAVVTIFPPLLLLHTYWGNVFTGTYLRLFLLLTSGVLAAVCINREEDRLVQPVNLALGVLLVGSVHAIAQQLMAVTNYPFSLTWSEGNRFYDYSVFVDSKRYSYSGTLSIPYNDPGRYILWGLPFLIPQSPIWLHRLWNAVLWTVPYLILGYFLVRLSNLKPKEGWVFTLWVYLFLTQGPIYPPLILSAILVLLLVQPQNLPLSLVGSTLAGYYASSSRWTWLPAAASWAGFLWLSEVKLEKGEKWQMVVRRLILVAVIALVGFFGAALADPQLLKPGELATSTSLEQPLLWYRLFPNATFNPGILLALVIATGPLAILLVWAAVSKRWMINWLQKLVYAGVSLIFCGMGLVASVKIGGGNNLHNLDLFLVTLVILAGLMVKGKTSAFLRPSPAWVRGVVALVIILPAWNAFRSGTPLEIPPQEITNKALEYIRTRVAEAAQQGEVLFIDQRQLLTFGYIRGVSLVPEYEKKYLMDQTMAGNAEYFEYFYKDLANQRFSLIIIDPLFVTEKNLDYPFAEENNAWVEWVAKPLLCYYTDLRTIKNIDVQLLVPNPNPVNCP